MFGNAAKEGFGAMMAGGSGSVSVSNMLNKNVINKAGNYVADLINSVSQDPSGAGKKAAATGATYLMSGTGGPLAAAAKSSFQVTTNPFPVMIYQGTGIKPPFTFEWEMHPETREEADTIRKIVNYFRREMLPELMEVNSTILKTPAIFEIKMNPNQYTRQFKRCVLTDMSVNYMPNGVAFIAKDHTTYPVDTVPAAVALSLTFREIEVWLADDFYADENNSFSVKEAGPPASMPGTQGVAANTKTIGMASGTPFGM
jgi:hypothetical protein